MQSRRTVFLFCSNDKMRSECSLIQDSPIPRLLRHGVTQKLNLVARFATVDDSDCVASGPTVLLSGISPGLRLLADVGT